MFKNNNANNVILVCVLSLNIFHTFSSVTIIYFGQKKLAVILVSEAYLSCQITMVEFFVRMFQRL